MCVQHKLVRKRYDESNFHRDSSACSSVCRVTSHKCVFILIPWLIAIKTPANFYPSYQLRKSYYHFKCKHVRLVSTNTIFTLSGDLISPSESITGSISLSNSFLGPWWLFMARKRSYRCNYRLFSCLSQQCHHVSSQPQREKQTGMHPLIPYTAEMLYSYRWIKKDFKKKIDTQLSYKLTFSIMITSVVTTTNCILL